MKSYQQWDNADFRDSEARAGNFVAGLVLAMVWIVCLGAALVLMIYLVCEKQIITPNRPQPAKQGRAVTPAPILATWTLPPSMLRALVPPPPHAECRLYPTNSPTKP